MNPQQILDACDQLGVTVAAAAGSLRITGNVEALSDDLLSQLRTHKAAVLDVLIAVDSAAMDESASARLPLTSTQRDIWLDTQVHESTAYNMVAAFRLAGTVDRDAMTQAVAVLVGRHDALRATFAADDGVPWLVVGKGRDAKLRILEYTHGSSRLEDVIAGEQAHHFDLQRGPLFRTTLVQLDAQGHEHGLVFNVHHAIADGASVAALVGELGRLYDAFATGKPASMPALQANLGETLERLAGRKRDAQYARGLDFFRERLQHAPPTHGIALDGRRTAARRRGAELRLPLEASDAAAIDALARTHATTRFTVWNTLFASFVGRWTNESEVVVGVPFDTRDTAASESVLGCFVNMVPCHHLVDHDASLERALASMGTQLRATLEHGAVEFSDIVQHVAAERIVGAAPVFQLVFSMQEQSHEALALHGLSCAAVDMSNTTNKYDLSLRVERSAEATTCVFEYDGGLFAEGTMRSLVRSFETFLHAAITTPSQSIATLPLLRPEQASDLVDSLNPAPRGYPRDTSLGALFRAVVAAHGERTALIEADDTVDYSSLQRRVEANAAALCGAGVRAGDRVGLVLPRGVAHIGAALACVLLGAAYVPLDPAYPMARLRAMVEGAGVRVLMTDATQRPLIDVGELGDDISTIDVNTIDLDARLPDQGVVNVAATDVAYVMFTSGSTGKPKPIAISHRNVVRLVHGQDYVELGPDRVVLHASSPSFDASTFEIWGALLHGAALVVAPPTLHSLRDYRALIERHGVCTAWFTAGLFHNLIDYERKAFAQLDQVLAGGDVLSVAKTRALRQTYPNLRIVNGYGPTENTTFTTTFAVEAVDEDVVRLPIGRPINHTRVFVLDGDDQICPVGRVGELCTSGDGLSDGYLGLPEQTAARFVANPQGGGAPIYRTGDLARVNAEGVLEFVGRRDGQVKVRGFRVELSELQAVAEACDGVGKAVAIVDRDQDNLCLYVEGSDDSNDSIVERVRRHLSARLPAFMQPSFVTRLSSLPLTNNGKLDRAALPKPQRSPSPKRVGPQTALEHVVWSIWTEVLDSQTLGIDDDFFSLGGHSILATQIIARIEQKVGQVIPVRVLFEKPTVRALAAWLQSASMATTESAAGHANIDTNNLPLTPQQQRIWLAAHKADDGAYTIPGAFDLHGEIDVARLEAALAWVAQQHAAFRVQVHEVDGQAHQSLRPEASVQLRTSTVAPADLDAAIAAFVAEGIPLAAPCLFRFELLDVREGHHVMLINAHHIVADGWGLHVVARDLLGAYASLTAGHALEAHEGDGDYVEAVLEATKGVEAARAASVEHWRAQLQDVPLDARLPFDFARDEALRRTGDLHLELSTEVLAGLRGLAQAHKTTLFNVLLAAFGCVLRGWTGTDSVVLGYPDAGRRTLRDESIVASFVDTSLCVLSDDGETFDALLGSLHQQRLADQAYGAVPFAPLLRALGRNATDHDALVPVFFNLVNIPNIDFELEGATVHARELSTHASKFDLALYLREAPQGLRIHAAYRADLFRLQTVEALMGQFEAVLSALVLDGGESIAVPQPPSVVIEAEAASHEHPQPLPAVLWRSFERHGDRVALVVGEETMTYRRLWEAVLSTRRRLRDAGVDAGDVVAIHGGRSAHVVTAMLACWHLGAAFCILDAKYPAARVQACLQAVPAVAVVVTQPQADPIDHATTVELFDLPAAEDVAATPHDTQIDERAYVSFTSGTSGVPRVVDGSHGSFAAFAPWFIDTHALDADDRFSVLCGVAHDPFHREVLLPLTIGAAAYVPHEAEVCEDRLSSWIEANGITVTNMTPTLLDLLCKGGQRLGSLRHLFVVGESFVPRHADALAQLAPQTTVTNLYGATEMHWALAHHVVHESLEDAVPRRVAIGRGIRGVDVRVERTDGSLCGPLELGEIVIASRYGSRGYLDLSQHQEAFREVDGQTIYRTGDLGRYDAQGAIVCEGRRDGQLKIAGTRIELAEIDHCLRSAPEVASAVTVDVSQGDRVELVAFVVARRGCRIDVEALHGRLEGSLPRVVRPRRVHVLDTLPLTHNRKIDREALRREGRENTRDVVSPIGPHEALVVEVLAGVLDLEEASIGRESDFFALGGHSVHAAQLVSRLHQRSGVRLQLREVFTHPVVQDLASAIERGEAMSPSADAVANDETDAAPQSNESLPLTFLQRKFYVQESLLGRAGGLTIPLAVEIRGALDVPRLEAAIGHVVASHGALRVAFVAGPEGTVTQRVRSAVEIGVRQLDVSDAQLDARLQEEWATPISLDDDALVRFTLLRTPSCFVLSLVLHHLVSDGWSVSVLIDDIQRHYRESTSSAGSTTDTLDGDGGYARYLERRVDAQTRALANLDRDYWTAMFEGLPSRVEFESDLERDGEFAGDHAWTLNPDLVGQVEAMAASSRVTTFAIISSAFYVALARWTGQGDLPVALPVHGRDDAALERVVGCLISTHLLRVRVKHDDDFHTLVQRCWNDLLEADAQQVLPHELAAEALGFKAGGNGSFYNVLVSHQNTPRQQVELPGLEVEQRFGARGVAKVDLAFVFNSADDALRCQFLYDTTRFTKGSIAAFGRLFEGLVRACVAQPNATLRHLQPEAPDAASGASDQPEARPLSLSCPTFVDSLRRTARMHPRAICAVFNDRTWTFSDLVERSNRVSNALRARGVGPGDRVGILVGRSLDMLSALIGTLQLGACYVPLDPDYPAERLRFIVEDSGITTTICEREHLGVLRGTTISDAAVIDWSTLLEQLDRYDAELHAPEVSSDELAYIMYTSGTTGRPKGVCITHGGLLNHIHAAIEVFGFVPGDRILQLNTINFDISVEEIFPTLISGACIVFYPETKALSAEGLARVIDRHGITVLNFTTALWRVLVLGSERNLVQELRCMIVGGEEIKRPDLERWRALGGDGVTLFNTYGPTEITVFCSYWRYDADFQAGNRDKVPIGIPVYNYRLYVLDADLNPCAQGSVGELWVGGVGLARCYNNNPRATAERFVPNPFGPTGSRMYKTGDRVRINDGGHIVYLGRSDNMVKVNGFRVELAEIEAVAQRFETVAEALAVARREDDFTRLILYVVADKGGTSLDEDALRRHLHDALPAFMRPHHVVSLQAIPLNDNRKVDFAALPAPATKSRTDDAGGNELERRVIAVWREVLPGVDIARDAGFFELGGNSLQLIDLHKKLCAAFAREIDVVAVFQHSTVAEFAVYLADMGATAASPSQPSKDTALNERVAQRRAVLARRARTGRTA